MKETRKEELITSNLVYDGAVVHLYVDEVKLPDGKKAIREYSKHIGAVAVLPLTDDGMVYCVRQYRHAHRMVLLEIPAGKLDSPDENHVEGALRELKEETGCSCRKLYSLGLFRSTPAIFDEKIDLFLATDLTDGVQKLDDDEFLSVEKIPLETLYQMVMKNEITDGKTICAVLKAWEIVKHHYPKGESLI